MRRRIMMNQEVSSVESEDTFSKDLVAYYNVADLDNESLSVNPILPDLSGNGHDMELKNFGLSFTPLTSWIIDSANTLTRTSNSVSCTNIIDDTAFIWTNVDDTTSKVIVKVEGLLPGQSLSFGHDAYKSKAFIVTTNGIYTVNYNELAVDNSQNQINRCIWSDTILGSCNFTVSFYNYLGELDTYSTDFSTWNTYSNNVTVISMANNKISVTHTAFGSDTLSWVMALTASDSVPEMLVKIKTSATSNLLYRYWDGKQLVMKRLTNGINIIPASIAHTGDASYIGFCNQAGQVNNTTTIELLPNYSGIREIYPEDFTRYNLGYINGDDHSDFEVTATPTKIVANVISLDKASGAGTIAYIDTTVTNSLPAVRVRVTHNLKTTSNWRLVYYYYPKGETGLKYIVLENGVYNLPASHNAGKTNQWCGYLLRYTSEEDLTYSIGDYIVIEQLPIDKYLQFDGVDDYGKAGNIPLLTDFTVIAKRKIYEIKNGCILNKGDGTYGSNNTISLEGMERLQPSFPCVYSMGASTSIDIYNSEITYMTKSSYNGKDIYIGSTPDDSTNIYIGTFRDGDSRYLNGNISVLLLFNRTLTLSEINQAIQKYIW